jgi:hypothetical protein
MVLTAQAQGSSVLSISNFEDEIRVEVEDGDAGYFRT